MFASREAQLFLEGLDNPEATQSTILLKKTLEPNRDCEFGRAHGFDKISSVAEYQRAVPIQKYDGFADAIRRIVHDGEQGILTKDRVKRFFMTSGSTSEPKYIPVTSRFIQAKSRAFGIYWSSVFGDHPAAKEGRMITNFSDSGVPGKTPGGIECGSESSFWAGVTRATQLSKTPIIPKPVAQIKDSNARYYTLARILLEETFSVIMTLNPSTILLLFKKIQEFAEPLFRDIEHGTLSSDVEVSDVVREFVAETYKGNPARAEALRAVVAESGADGLLAHRLWPDLSLAICWRSPMLKPYIDLLDPHFGDRVAGRDYMMMASEGIMGVPLRDGGSGGVCGVGLHFYEFVPEDEIDKPDPTVLLPHQVEVGKTYVLILTNGSGLYRYNIGDVIRVTGFERKAPIIEFLHRAGRTCSLTGEKLTETQVTAAIEDTGRELGLDVEGFTVAPAPEGFPRYVAYLELRNAASPDALGAFPAAFDAALDRHNIEYGSKRGSQRLAAPELWVVEAGTYAKLRQQRTAAGASDSQIKPMHLTRDASFAERVSVTSRHQAG